VFQYLIAFKAVESTTIRKIIPYVLRDVILIVVYLGWIS